MLMVRDWVAFIAGKGGCGSGRARYARRVAATWMTEQKWRCAEARWRYGGGTVASQSHWREGGALARLGVVSTVRQASAGGMERGTGVGTRRAAQTRALMAREGCRRGGAGGGIHWRGAGAARGD